MSAVASGPKMSELIELVASVLKGVNPQDMTEVTDLYALGLDSGAAVELMLAVESQYNMSFPDTMIDEATFRTPQALFNAVSQVIG